MVSVPLALSRRIRNCAALALLCAAPGAAEEALANVSGTVADRETGEPIYGAVVKIERPGIESAGQALQGVTTGKNGGFFLRDIEAGAKLPEHAHPHEQVSNLLEGEFEMTVNGTETRLTEGSVAVIPSNAVHSGRAITAWRFIDIFQPVREDYL